MAYDKMHPVVTPEIVCELTHLNNNKNNNNNKSKTTKNKTKTNKKVKFDKYQCGRFGVLDLGLDNNATKYTNTDLNPNKE